MSRSAPRQSVLATIIVIVLAVAVEYFRRQERGGSSRGRGPQTTARPPQSRDWQRLEGCTLTRSGRNDGDSFVVSHQGTEYTFRLYFVDTPEKHAGDRKRVEDQGRYFGGLSIPQVTSLGEEAKDYVLSTLQSASFTVWTRWEAVYDSDRMYALVTLPDGSDLGTQLIQRGLARIHTQPVDLPDGTRSNAARDRLRRIEAEAKKDGRGGWGR